MTSLIQLRPYLPHYTWMICWESVIITWDILLYPWWWRAHDFLDCVIDLKQECIPVGCIPAAHWPYAAVFFLAGRGDVTLKPRSMSLRHVWLFKQKMFCKTISTWELNQGCVRFPETLHNLSVHQILWSFCSVVFHALTLKFPIQTLHSVAPELQVFCEFTWKLSKIQQNEHTGNLSGNWRC